ncbi:RidA family protein [Dechloromonas sp. HYN0024]|uniref:RidA family protein n=1 Tax=Dechloromonas sp. HYN0024 TaxID=2231055 RepID=UPI000E43EF49|nr:RidA family protein [Dechloromonas sp. HYN0024]AXS80785.1 RidA family protein [Dechloromonas sp. HYN0024]
MSIQRHGTTRRYSDSVVHAGTVYLVEVPANLDSDVAAQTDNVLTSVDRLLAQAGSDRSRLLMVTIYLADMADYEAMNVVWDAWVPAGHAPTRACVQARLSHEKYRVEVVLTAAVTQA